MPADAADGSPASKHRVLRPKGAAAAAEGCHASRGRGAKRGMLLLQLLIAILLGWLVAGFLGAGLRRFAFIPPLVVAVVASVAWIADG